MMNYKFRAWDNINNEMIELDGIDGDLGFRITGGYRKIYELKYVMQYTGIKDKNGKEIYEDDIVEYKPIKDSNIGFISRIYCDMMYGTTIRYNDFHGWRESYIAKIRENVEVIGNIYTIKL